MPSSTILFLANAFLKLPFGLAEFFMPAFTFGQLGLVNLEESTLTLIRGYASPCLGYGCAMLKLGKVEDDVVEHGLLITSLVFNGCESVLQLHAALLLGDAFNGMIWTSVI
jgi:hypothetical protein